MPRSSAPMSQDWVSSITQRTASIDRVILTAAGVILFQYLSVVEPLWSAHKEITVETEDYKDTVADIQESFDALEKAEAKLCAAEKSKTCPEEEVKARFIAKASLADIERYRELEELRSKLKNERNAMSDNSVIDVFGFKLPMLRVLSPTAGIAQILFVLLWVVWKRNQLLQEITETVAGAFANPSLRKRSVIPGRWWMATFPRSTYEERNDRRQARYLKLFFDWTAPRRLRMELINLGVFLILLVLVSRHWLISWNVFTQFPPLETQKPVEDYLRPLAFVSNCFALLCLPLILDLFTGFIARNKLSQAFQNQDAATRRLVVINGLLMAILPPFALSAQKDSSSAQQDATPVQRGIAVVRNPRWRKRPPVASLDLASSALSKENGFVLDLKTKSLYPIFEGRALGIWPEIARDPRSVEYLDHVDFLKMEFNGEAVRFASRWEVFAIEIAAVRKINAGDAEGAAAILLASIARLSTGVTESHISRQTKRKRGWTPYMPALPTTPWDGRANRLASLFTLLAVQSLDERKSELLMAKHLPSPVADSLARLRMKEASTRRRKVYEPSQKIIWKTPLPLTRERKAMATIIPFRA